MKCWGIFVFESGYLVSGLVIQTYTSFVLYGKIYFIFLHAVACLSLSSLKMYA